MNARGVKRRITAIFEAWKKQNPAPKGELQHSNHYQFLVAVVLSAQATDISVNKATQPLFETIKTPSDMLSLGEEALCQYIKSIGLFRSKAKYVIALSRILVDTYHSKVPDTLASLVALPGVGRKTANVVLNDAFGLPTIAVDTHVYRVAKRLGFSKSNTVEGVEHDLQKNVPDTFKRHAHHWMILHGRYVCKARNPDCARCTVAMFCHSVDKNTDAHRGL